MISQGKHMVSMAQWKRRKIGLTPSAAIKKYGAQVSMTMRIQRLIRKRILELLLAEDEVN